MLQAQNKEPVRGNSTRKFNELNVREKLFSSCKTASVGRILARARAHVCTFTYTCSQIASLFTNKLPKLAGRRPEVLTGSSQMNAVRVTYFESRQIDFLSSYGLTYLLQREYRRNRRERLNWMRRMDKV